MNRVALLDVNVLVALFEPDHVHHELAHDWFAERRDSGWATCPVTETGLVRMLMNPRVRGGVAIAASAVIDRLRTFRADATHHWWEADVSLADASIFRPTAVQGHRRVTDLYLAGLAHARGGKLVTFDQSVLWNAIVGARPSLVEVLAADQDD
jgi:toxin-antitoxin system PIN domain toxin